MLTRAELHDQSKLESPEVEAFTEYTPKLKDCTYGSDEYKGYLEAIKPALDHHYANNRHHPEHWPEKESSEADLLEKHLATLDKEIQPELYAVLEDQIKSLRSSLNNMNLLDLVEMAADWLAASERHSDGNIRKSIKINSKRFDMGIQMINIFENTIEVFK